jgi:hypothetical protein
MRTLHLIGPYDRDLLTFEASEGTIGEDVASWIESEKGVENIRFVYRRRFVDLWEDFSKFDTTPSTPIVYYFQMYSSHDSFCSARICQLPSWALPASLRLSRTRHPKRIPPPVDSAPFFDWPCLQFPLYEYYAANRPEWEAILERGPPFPFYGGDSAQVDELPKRPFTVIDEHGHKTSLALETNAVFIQPEGLPAERFFRKSILQLHFLQLPILNGVLMRMTMEVTVGYRTFFFIPLIYRNAIQQAVENMDSG